MSTEINNMMRLKNSSVFNYSYTTTLIIIFSCLLVRCNEYSKNDKNVVSNKNLYWGDIHNHNAIGYARGSLERSYDIARSHLDMYCFTGHSQWHDMPVMPENKQMKWVDGFKNVEKNWRGQNWDVLDLCLVQSGLVRI